MASALLCLSATRTHAQGRTDDRERALTNLYPLIAPPSDLRLAKKREAKREHHWVFTGIGFVGFGFDSNVHLSPNSLVQSSPYGAFGARLEALRYTKNEHRFQLTARALGMQHTGDSNANPYSQDLTALWGKRRTGKYSASAFVRAKHSNDASTNIAGRDLLRSFEYFMYQGSVGAWLYPNRDNALRLSATVKRRDYKETPGLVSIDWVKVGPRIAYHLDLGDRIQSEVFYAFTYQRYDSNPAANSIGIRLPSAPKESHFFHASGLQLQFDPYDWLAATLGYKWKAKDDLYESFESYKANLVDVGVQYVPGKKWQITLGAAYQHRDYEKRPGTFTEKLRSDRWTAQVRVGYRYSYHVTLYVSYDLTDRDTNRTAPFTTFRPYTRHLALAGVTVAY